MARTACLVGNSSSGIREGAFIGTPAVNIGTRQTERRARAATSSTSATTARQIADAVERQLEHGRYESEPIYGDGNAGPHRGHPRDRRADDPETHHLLAQPTMSGGCSTSRIVCFDSRDSRSMRTAAVQTVVAPSGRVTVLASPTDE